MTIQKLSSVSLLILLLTATLMAQTPDPKKNLLGNPDFEGLTELGKPVNEDAQFKSVPELGISRTGWCSGALPGLVSDQYVHSGKRAIFMESKDNQHRGSICQRIRFDKPLNEPFWFGGWSRAENSELEEEYSIYLDIFYEDGTNLWGQTAEFSPGSHDWEFSDSYIVPNKPIREIQFFILFRHNCGKVWFDDVFIERAPHLMDKAFHQKFREEQRKQMMTIQPERPYFLWTATSMKRIFLDSIPELPEDIGEWNKIFDQPKYSLDLAQNEYESFQLAILAKKEMKNIRFEISDLVNKSDSSKKIVKQNIEWQQIGFIMADKLHYNPQQSEGVAGWYPDVLLPVSKGIALENKTCPFWITVYAPKGTAPGNYQGTIRIVPESGPVSEVVLDVRVRNIELSNECHLKTAFALMDGFLEKVYNVPRAKSENDPTPIHKIRMKYCDFLAKHRISPEGDITRTELPNIDILEHLRSTDQLGAFSILNMVQSRGNNPWQCNSPTNSYKPEFKKATLEKLKPYIAELRKRNLLKNAYIYTFDERTEEYHGIMSEYFGMIKENFPEVATFTTAYLPQEPDLLDKLHLDWICPVSSKYDYKKAENCRTRGKQVWSYICCGPGFPYANIMFRFPLIGARILGWQSYEQKYDGLLYWGVNIWSNPKCVPFDPEAGILLDWSMMLEIGIEIYGDGNLLYANKNGDPIGSIRLAVLRDGMEDYEYFWQLGKKMGSVDEARTWCRPVFNNPRKYSKDPTLLLQQRKKIADALEK